MVRTRDPEVVEIHVSVVGLDGVGKTTLLSQLEARQRQYDCRSDFFRDYILEATCSPDNGAKSQEKVKFIFKEVDLRRYKTQPLQGLFKDGIVIMVYNDLDKKSFDFVLNLAKGIKSAFPDVIFFFLGNKAQNVPTLGVTSEDVTEDMGLADTIKLHLRARSFSSLEFLKAFLPDFLKMSYYKNCQDRGLPADQPETVAVKANCSHLPLSYTQRCCIL